MVAALLVVRDALVLHDGLADALLPARAVVGDYQHVLPGGEVLLGPFAEGGQVAVIAHVGHAHFLDELGAHPAHVVVLLYKVAAHAGPVVVRGVVAVHAADLDHDIDLLAGTDQFHLVYVAEEEAFQVVLGVGEDHDGPLGLALAEEPVEYALILRLGDQGFGRKGQLHPGDLVHYAAAAGGPVEIDGPAGRRHQKGRYSRNRCLTHHRSSRLDHRQPRYSVARPRRPGKERRTQEGAAIGPTGNAKAAGRNPRPSSFQPDLVYCWFIQAANSSHCEAEAQRSSS